MKQVLVIECIKEGIMVKDYGSSILTLRTDQVEALNLSVYVPSGSISWAEPSIKIHMISREMWWIKFIDKSSDFDGVDQKMSYQQGLNEKMTKLWATWMEDIFGEGKYLTKVNAKKFGL